MDRRDFLSGLSLTCASSVVAAEALAKPEASTTLPTAPPTVTERVSPTVHESISLVPLSSVRLLEGPVAHQQETNRQYLLKLDPDRLLSCFRQEAGLDPKAPPYRGWESEGPTPLYGHILGFYLSGAGMMVQATGEPTLKRRLDYISDELEAVQTANGSGYLLAVPNGKKLFQDIAAGHFEITKPEVKYGFEINDVFEPTYTWNKITLGLYQSHLATGNPKTRAVLIRTADWFGAEVLDRLTDAQIQALLFCEHGSIHESMLEVFQLTADRKYLKWARRLCFERLLIPLEKGDGDFLDGYHANCSVPVFTGFERIYQHSGEERLHKAAVNFLNEVISRRSWVIGGNSAREHFFPTSEYENALHAPAGPETCNSVNTLRLIEAVYPVAPDPRFIDQYERILWNHLLAAHEPDRGTVCYYTPLQPGSYRVYSDEFDSMWCCVGTGLECPGKYGKLIYSLGPQQQSVNVNLFIASQLSHQAAGLVLRQDTNFPDSPSTTLTVVEAPRSTFTLRVRHPWWIGKGSMRIRLNGALTASDTAPGEYALITRRWRSGDRLDVDLPMHLSIAKLPFSENYVAILYGPIVLSGQLGTGGLTRRSFWQTTDPLGDKLSPEYDFPQITVTTDELLTHCVAVKNSPLAFVLSGAALSTSTAVPLVPFYRNHHQRYAVYWKLKSATAS